MKNTKKVLLGGVAALALVGTSVFGTYMYLTSTTDTVTNTFTVGDVTIKLDETDITNPDGPRTENGNNYKVYPGQNYVKDPKVTVDQNSEDAYVFVKVVNGLGGLEATNQEPLRNSDGTNVQDKFYVPIADQIAANHWAEMESASTDDYSVYYYCGSNNDTNGSIVSANEELSVFNNFQISETVKNDTTIDASNNVEITAYAVQAKGFTTAAEAWGAAPTNWN